MFQSGSDDRYAACHWDMTPNYPLLVPQLRIGLRHIEPKSIALPLRYWGLYIKELFIQNY